MKCRAARKRLVAYQDRELSPADELRVREHLQTCAACADLERRLAAVTPRPFLQVDPEVEAEAWARLDVAVQAALDEPPRPREATLWERAGTWLAEETRMPTGAVLAYAALLVMAVAWGASNWWTVSQLQAALESDDGTTTAMAPVPVGPVVPAEIPADQYRPASFTPDEPPESP